MARCGVSKRSSGRVAAALSGALGLLTAAAPAVAIVTGDGSLPALPGGLDLAGVGHLGNGCSSVLLAGGGYMLASAHCAALPGSSVSFGGGTLTAQVVATVISPDYAGTPLGDLSVSRLATPVTGITGWTLSDTALPSAVLLAGYGVAGSGATGAAGLLRYGYNEYERLLADEPTAAPPAFYFGAVFAFDFDDGSPTTNRFGSLGFPGEAMVASGDSGGPTFSFESGEWRVVGIHSAVDDALGYGYGAVGYDVRVAAYAGWVGDVTAVPEPASAGLLLAGLLGVAGRRYAGVRAARRGVTGESGKAGSAMRVSNLARCTLK